MMCPTCGRSTTTIVQTVPADKRSDGRVYRLRRCRDRRCNATVTTLEVLHSEAAPCPAPSSPSKEQHAPPPPQKDEHPNPKEVAIPAATPPSVVYDLEGNLEAGLPLAVECIVDAVSPGTNPDKVKIDAAKWLIDDRRKWRIQIAEQANKAGTTPEDPAMAELANILRLVDEAV